MDHAWLAKVISNADFNTNKNIAKAALFRKPCLQPSMFITFYTEEKISSLYSIRENNFPISLQGMSVHLLLESDQDVSSVLGCFILGTLLPETGCAVRCLSV